MALLKHFDYTPDEADANVRFELRNQGSSEDGEARVALTVVDLESDGGDDENVTIQLAAPDIEGLIEALEQTLEELVPIEEGADEEEAQQEQVEEPEAERPTRRTRGSKRQQEDDEE